MSNLMTLFMFIPLFVFALKFWLGVWHFLVRNRKTLGKRVQVAKDAFFTVTREG